MSNNFTNYSQENGSRPLFSVPTIIQVACLPLIIAAGLIGNTLICVAVWKRTKLRAIDCFILNLAITDLGICVISIPFDFVEILSTRWPFGRALCKMVYPLQTVLVAVSVYTLLCMSLERHRAVIRPFKPKIKSKKTFGIIIFGWVFSLILVTPYVNTLDVKSSGFCAETWSKTYIRMFTLFVFVIEYLMPMFVITGAYVKISQKLCKDIQRIRKATGSYERGKKPHAEARSHRNMRIVKIFIFAVIAFAFCMLPTHVMWIWSGFGNGSSYKHFGSILVFCNILMYSNSAINPFIFVFLHRRYCRGLCDCCSFALVRGFSQTLSPTRTRSLKRLSYNQRRSPYGFDRVKAFNENPIGAEYYAMQAVPALKVDQRREMNVLLKKHIFQNEKSRTIAPRKQKVNFGGANMI